MIKSIIKLSLILVVVIVTFTSCAKNGFHEVHYTGKYKGYVYKGNYHNGRRDGYGVFIWPGDVTYKGNWYRGKQEGQGTMIWPKSHKNGYAYFKGYFSYGKASGKGTFVNKYGTIYKAYWHGWNISTTKESTAIFKDKIIRGKFKGKIPYSIDMPNKVELEYLTKKHFYYNGKKVLVPEHSKFYGYVDKYYNATGYGKLVFSDGKHIYQGDFKKPETLVLLYTKKYQKELEQKEREKDYKNQKCTTYNKWIYLGDQCNSNHKADGFGKAISLDGTMSFSGEFKNGLFIKGTYINQNEKYIGSLFNGRLDGYAEYYVNNKPVYKGNFKNGKKYGKGICYNQGIEEACEYENNIRIDSIYLKRQELKRLKNQMKKEQERLKKEQKRLEEQRRILEQQNSYNDNYRNKSSSSWGDQFVKSLKVATDEIIAQKRASLEQKKANYARLRQYNENQRIIKEQKNRQITYKQTQLKKQYDRNQRLAQQRLLILEKQKQKLALENKRRLEELKRQQKIAQDKEDKRLAKQRYLKQLENGINLAGRRCYGSNYVGGQIPNISPKPVSCIDVHYRVSCPSNSYNTYEGVLKNMVSNMGGCFGDISKVEKNIGCEAKDFIVKVKEVTPCQ
jgi:hypothetical protein